MISVIIPAFNEESMLPVAAETINSVLKANSIPCELIFVDDGSVDNTWQEIEKASRRFDNVRGVHFSRNFGKEAAIIAGLNEVLGDCCVVIDCDLQHPPETIVEMYHLWQSGFEIVEGVKTSRGKEGRLHRLCAHWFYSLISKSTGFNMENSSDFKLLDRKAVDVLKLTTEKNAFFRAMSSWVGFKTTTVSFEVRERAAGTSKWSGGALTKYAVHNITSFSAAPMQIVTVLGVITFLISLVMGFIALWQKLMGIALDGFTTVIVLILLFGSIMMMSLGIVGYYISRIFEEVKNRPLYIISEKCGERSDK